jgi:divalent metal cation (Fe/Co/Zn/Cd) transporter
MLSGKALALVSAGIALLAFCANFGIFLYAYHRLVFPHLSEWQRLENVDYIFTVTLGSFATVSTVIGVAFFLAIRRDRQLLS